MISNCLTQGVRRVRKRNVKSPRIVQGEGEGQLDSRPTVLDQFSSGADKSALRLVAGNRHGSVGPGD